MSRRSTGMKAVSLFIGLLFCMVLVQTAFATENITVGDTATGNENTDNMSVGNETSQIYPISNQIDPSSDYRSIVAGNRDYFTVSFTNKGNETLALTPKLVTTPNSGNNINESWITISPTNATVAPGSVQNFILK